MAVTPLEYEQKRQRLVAFLQARRGSHVRLGKDTSNLFRERKQAPGGRLDVRDFNNVLHVDPQSGIVDVEGMTPYVDLTRECLKHGVMPAVVPQLKSITIGGAVSGVGIESSSFKYGLVHETVQEMEVLLGSGDTVLCTPDNEHSALFYGLPNSYGTLGYVLRLKVKTVPVKPFVKLTHVHHRDAREYFADLGHWCGRDVDFVDGTVFGEGEYYLTIGEFVEEAPYTSDYTFENIYYRSIRERDTDYLTTEDYIWRWDTDWFWCSKNLYAQKPLVRRLLGRSRLNSITYTRMMRWNSKWQVTRSLERLLGYRSESVIQDVDIPLGHCPDFLDFYFEHIRFTPVWICPIRAWDKAARFALYPMDPDETYVNFGFWDVIRGRKDLPDGYYNRLVEARVRELGGIKSLYSDSYFTPEEFWSIYNKASYDALKQKYDPDRTLKDLYAKCVRKE